MGNASQVPVHALSLFFELSEQASAFVYEVAMQRTRAFVGAKVEIDDGRIELSAEALRWIALQPHRVPEQVCWLEFTRASLCIRKVLAAAQPLSAPEPEAH